MKKTFLLALFTLSVSFFLETTHAELACIQVIQPAIGPSGECQEFPTPCDVPDDWKKVTASCKEVKEKNFGSRIEDVLERRLRGVYSKESDAYESNTQENLIRNRYSFRRYTGGKANRRSMNKTNDRKLTNYRGRRTTTNRYRSVNSYLKKDLSERQAKKRVNYTTRKRLSNSSGGIRSGAFTNNPKWHVQSRSHFSKGLQDYSKPRAWRSTASIRSEEALKKRAENKPTARRATLRKLYTGTRDRVFGNNLGQ